MITTLDEETAYTIGVVMVGIDEADLDAVDSVCDGTSIRATKELSTAIKWRNGTETEFDWDGSTVPDRIFALVRGDPPKIGSLHRLSLVSQWGQLGSQSVS